MNTLRIVSNCTVLGAVGLAALIGCGSAATSETEQDGNTVESTLSPLSGHNDRRFDWWRGERARRQTELDAYVASNRADFDALRRNPAGNVGVPVILFRLLPELFPEIWGAPAANFADSFSKIGLAADPFEPSRLLPLGLGFSGANPPIATPAGEVRVNVVQVTCSSCHTGRVEVASGKILPLIGAPNTQFQFYRYRALLAASANHPGLTADRFVGAIRAKSAGWLYNDPAMATQEALETAIFLANPDAVLTAFKAGVNAGGARVRATLLATTYAVPNAPNLSGPNPGSMDAMAGFASLVVDPAKFASVAEMAAVLPPAPASVDFQPLWRGADRGGHKWGNDVANPYFANAFAAFGMIGSPTAVDMATVGASTRFGERLPPTPYPFDVDFPSARRGQNIFAKKCVSCHAPGETKVFTPEESGTDPNRAKVLTPYTVAGLRMAARVACNDPVTCSDHGNPVADEAILRITGGIAAVPLAGIWARAPYLHNGSVPTLRALLTGDRPAKFFRGNVAYDPKDVGFASDAPQTPSSAEYDTTKAGNSNTGHIGSNFGGPFNQTPHELDDLLEFLKTL